MLYIGIDPGLAGAIAAIGDQSGCIDIYPMPILTAKKGKGRKEYDLHAIKGLLRLWHRSRPVFVTLEKAQPLPPTIRAGGIANFHAGVNKAWEWVLAVMEIPYEVVQPRTWQARMHAGTPGEDTKQRSILAAQRLFPEVDFRRSERARKPDEGSCEAILIAEYGRRTRK